MKEGVLADEVRLLLEGEAALGLDGFQAGEIGEAPIGEWLVGERPEMLSRLEFRGVGRQGDQMDAVWDLDCLSGVPPSAIQDQRDPFGWSCPHIPSEGGQHLAEEGSGDGGEEPPLGRSCSGPDKATQVEPLVALLHRRHRPLPNRCPHPANEREEADPVLIGGPELDLGPRMRGSDLGYLVAELC
jgi:hypothetical protein